VLGRRFILYLICCLIWGSTWLAIKVGLRDLPPLLFAGLRMGLASLILLPLAARGRFRATAREWRAIALAGFLQIGLSYALVFTAENRIDSGLTAVLFGTFPIWVGLIAHFQLPDDPLTPATAIAAVLGLAGVGILEAPALARLSFAGGLALASLLPIGSAIASAVSNVIIKKRLSGVAPSVNLWGQTAVGGAFLLILSAFERGVPRWTPLAIGSLAYLTIFGTVIAFLCLFWLLPRVPIAAIGAIPLIDTLVAVVLGAVILREPLGWRLFAGGALILAGAGLATLRRPGRVSSPASAV
jgi:drug/metabolite transporter (DMT)-like permease